MQLPFCLLWQAKLKTERAPWHTIPRADTGELIVPLNSPGTLRLDLTLDWH